MALTLGIIGLAKSGKTTVFNALTRGTAATDTYGATQPNVGTVKVPDVRLDKLTDMYTPKKRVPADVEYVDVAGMAKGQVQSGGTLPGLNYIQRVDALMHVVRAFDDPNVPHPETSVDPLRDIQTLDLELAFSDLAIIEKRIPRLDDTIKKVKGPERDVSIAEREVLLKAKEALEAETPLRELELSDDEQKLMRGYQFLTLKPLLTLINVGEGEVEQQTTLQAEAQKVLAGQHNAGVATILGKAEAEIAQLDAEDAAAFLAEYGISESAQGRIIRASYDLLGLISFFTAGEDECRAWPIKRSTDAVHAAGEIHSDFEKGFIRAVVVAYDDLIDAGDMVEARKRGKVREEGKTYIMKDGDVVEFRIGSIAQGKK